MNVINDFVQRFQNINKSSVFNNNNNTNNIDDANVTQREDMDGPPLRRPTTPMTNLSSTSNSQLMGGNQRLIA